MREIIRESPPSQPVERHVRRRSWSGADNNDDWVLVKKIKRRTKGTNKRSAKSDDSDSSSSSSSSSDEDDTVQKRPKGPAMVPMRYGIQRLDPYDLAVSGRRPMNMQPTMVNMVPMSSASAGQPRMMMTGLPTAQPGFVSVMMPQ